MAASRWLRTAALFLPYRRGLFARHLRLMRAGMAVAGRIAALRGVEVVPVSATASVRVHRPTGLSERTPALLWIHGGGYVAGREAMNDRALRWLAARDDIDRRRILIAGKSAGGGLAAALTLRHMDAGLVGLAGQILIY